MLDAYHGLLDHHPPRAHNAHPLARAMLPKGQESAVSTSRAYARQIAQCRAHPHMRLYCAASAASAAQIARHQAPAWTRPLERSKKHCKIRRPRSTARAAFQM